MKFRSTSWLLTLMLGLASTVEAAPIGYSVNSDEPEGDKLHEVDLATGVAVPVGAGLSLSRTDVEGLAFDNQGVLWGVDDESLRLFPIDTGTGQGLVGSEVGITGLNSLSGNDFGLTFTCEGDLYVTSVSSQTLYRLSLNGAAVPVGGTGQLGANISAIAAWGHPARLYGLGNGLLSESGPVDNRSLYEIDLVTGQAKVIGPMGDAVADYLQAGLSFDDNGTLWAITDRRFFESPQGSQVLTLDLSSGAATVQSTTTVTGFESLAVAEPGGCQGEPPSPFAHIGSVNSVPTLDALGRAVAVLVLLLAGAIILRRRMPAA